MPDMYGNLSDYEAKVVHNLQHDTMEVVGPERLAEEFKGKLKRIYFELDNTLNDTAKLLAFLEYGLKRTKLVACDRCQDMGHRIAVALENLSDQPLKEP